MKKLSDEEKEILAKKLDVGINEIDELQEIANKNWHLAVGQNKVTKLYHGLMYKYHTAPSGSISVILHFSCDTGRKTEEEAMVDANAIRGQIQLSTVMSDVCELPQKIYLLVDQLE